MHAVLFIAIVVLGGFVNRIRGGLWGTQIDTEIAAVDGGRKPGTQLARIIFAVVMGCFTALVFGNPWLLLTIFAWELGEFLPNGDYLGLSNIAQFGEADGVGLGNVLLTCVAIFFVTHLFAWPLAVAGLLKGTVYYVANKMPGPTLNIGFNPGAEMAELLFGMVLCAGLVLSVILPAIE